MIIGVPTKKRNNIVEDTAEFNHCKLMNCKLFLNSQYFPYDNLNVSFSKKRFNVLYNMYARF